MFYCPKCAIMCKTECPRCGRTRGLRTPAENDPVRLVEVDMLQSLLVESVLEESGIPFSRSDRMGWGLTLGFGTMLDSIAYYVPFCALENARELLTDVFADDGGIIAALKENMP